MNNEVAIAINDVGKNFKVPHEKHDTLKGKALNVFSSKKYSKYTALQNINFEVKKGEFFGIVGKNGCGKSTLLKIIAGIYQPTKGSVEVNGSIAPFIELGVGFNPELTGRENVFLSGTILGMTRKKIELLYDEIVAFAELEEFMDQKLKNYSSGMQVRLSFSIAIRSNSDILLIDEVLAVGDSNFQSKCFKVFEKYKKNKKTIILVTHDMSNVTQFCDRAVLIDQGRIKQIGSPKKVASEYMYLNTNQSIPDKKTSTGYKKVLSAKILPFNKNDTPVINYGDDITLHLEWINSLKPKNLGVAIINEKGETVFGSNTLHIKDFKPKNNMCKFRFNLNIGEGLYYLVYGAFGDTSSNVLHFVNDGPSFYVKNTNHTGWQGVTKLDSEWIY